MGKGIGGHHDPYRGRTDSWITPEFIIDALGPFDLDPCAAPNQPWPCAANSYSEYASGLEHSWGPENFWRIYCNPPYGPKTAKWLERCAAHGNAIALVFARTETSWFFSEIWNKADALLFLEGRLTFYHEDGKKAKANSGGPSVLVAYGKQNAQRLMTTNLRGKFVPLDNAWKRDKA